MKNKSRPVHALACLALLATGFSLQACDYVDALGDWGGAQLPGNLSSQAEPDSETGTCTQAPGETTSSVDTESSMTCPLGEQEACVVEGALGDCALGIRSCGHSGKWSACEPRFEAAPERCGARQEDAHGAASGDENCDGQVDEVDAQGCNVYMQDQDGDGWGAIGPSYAQDPENATHGCFCELPEALSHFKRAEGQENRDCGDCEEGGEFVHPEVFSYKQEPSACLEAQGNWAGGIYDYNCDGEVEYEYSKQGTTTGCGTEGGGCSYLGEGPWFTGRPECGESDGQINCVTQSPTPGKSVCTARQFSHRITQGCR